MRVAMAVLAYNRPELLKRTLASIQKAEHDYRLVLFDNASTNETADIVAERGGFRNHGKNHNIGFGFRMATHMALSWQPDLIVFSGDDYEYRNGWLRDLVQFWTHAPDDISIVGMCIDQSYPSNKIIGKVSYGGINGVQRAVTPGASWSFRASDALDILRTVPPDAHKYDRRVCLETKKRIIEIPLSTHIGLGHRIWTDRVETIGKEVDFSRWGLDEF